MRSTWVLGLLVVGMTRMTSFPGRRMIVGRTRGVIADCTVERLAIGGAGETLVGTEHADQAMVVAGRTGVGLAVMIAPAPRVGPEQRKYSWRHGQLDRHRSSQASSR